MPKEWPVGKKARGGSIQTLSGHPRPVKTEKSKTVRQDNDEASRRDEQQDRQSVFNAVNRVWITTATSNYAPCS